MTNRTEQSKALAHEARTTVLDLLKDPARHFAHQVSGDPADIGVCVTLLTDALGISQPTASKHLDILRRAGFLKVSKIGRWSFFRRDETGIADYKRWLNDSL